MDIAGEYTFDAPQAVVWGALLDPNVLGSIMPGGKGFEEVGENQYKGALEVKVGPVQGLFQADIKLTDIQPPTHYHIEVDGKGPAGFVKGTGSLNLSAQGNQTHMVYSGTATVGGRIASVGQRLMDSAARSIIRQSLEALNEYLKVEVANGSAAAPTAPSSPAPTESAPSTDLPSANASAANAADSASALATAAAAPVATAATTTTTATPSAAPTTTSPNAAAPQYKPPSQTSLALNVARDVLNDFVPPKYQPLLLGAIIVIILLLIWLVRR
ncbi:MAG: carbon monoxide dehydrogenase subunit G [Anaerolineae bacterium]